MDIDLLSEQMLIIAPSNYVLLPWPTSYICKIKIWTIHNINGFMTSWHSKVFAWSMDIFIWKGRSAN